MSDTDLRAFERAVSESPEDDVALTRLHEARIRLGLGWYGERLPENDQGMLVPDFEERGVYIWKRQDEAYPFRELMQVKLVYVPAGEVVCDHWLAPGTYEALIQGVPDPPAPGDRLTLTVPDGADGIRYNLGSSERCKTCKGSGSVKTEPFYIGQFPVTWGEYEDYCGAVEQHVSDKAGGRVRMYHYPPRPGYATQQHPVVNANPHGLPDASTGKHPIPGFLTWSGLRLPSRFEWQWAALGPPDQDWHLLPAWWTKMSTEASAALCSKCGKPCFGFETKCDVLSARAYPWGCDPPQSPKPSGSLWAFMWPNCVFDMSEPLPVLINDPGIEKEIKSLEEVKSQMVGNLYPGIAQDKIDKLKAKRKLVPARPGSRSWRNTYDMAGNVFELVEGSLALGGSFRSPTMEGWPRITGPLLERTQDDVGFRVAISAAAT